MSLATELFFCSFVPQGWKTVATLDI